MKKARGALDDLPVLTDFVSADAPEASASAPEAGGAPGARPYSALRPSDAALPGGTLPLPEVEEGAVAQFHRAREAPGAGPWLRDGGSRREAEPAVVSPSRRLGTESGGPVLPPGAVVMTRAQFDQRIAEKLEELQHAVFSQAMQQLELHAAGSLKERLRAALIPALDQVARDIAEQVAAETAEQVRAIVARAVEDEVRRLRERLAQRRT